MLDAWSQENNTSLLRSVGKNWITIHKINGIGGVYHSIYKYWFKVTNGLKKRPEYMKYIEENIGKL